MRWRRRSGSCSSPCRWPWCSTRSASSPPSPRSWTAGATCGSGCGRWRRRWSILFNLDAAVVLLTPLYVRIAQRHGDDPLALAFIPALMASLASTVLPVSNLTNLVVAEQLDVGAGDFLVHAAPAALVAVVVGWFGHRRRFPAPLGIAGVVDAVDRHAIAIGVPVVVWLLIGFTVGERLGAPAWTIAGVGARRAGRRDPAAAVAHGADRAGRAGARPRHARRRRRPRPPPRPAVRHRRARRRGGRVRRRRARCQRDEQPPGDGRVAALAGRPPGSGLGPAARRQPRSAAVGDRRAVDVAVAVDAGSRSVTPSAPGATPPSGGRSACRRWRRRSSSRVAMA